MRRSSTDVRKLLPAVLVTLAAGGLHANAQIAGTNGDCTNNGSGVFDHPNGTHSITVTGGQVSGAGATLFVDFFLSPSSTNDWIDVDNDGQAGFFPTFPFVDQLGTLYSVSGNLNTHWLFQYRSVGSVNGFNEFVESQTCSAKRVRIPAEAGQFNGFTYATLGNPATRPTNFDNPSGTPMEPCEIEFAFLDVPSKWGVRVPGNNSWDAKPLGVGYGFNPIPSSTGYISQLESLSRNCGTCTGDTASTCVGGHCTNGLGYIECSSAADCIRPCTGPENCNGTCNGAGIDFCLTSNDCSGNPCVGVTTCNNAGGPSALNHNILTPDPDTIFDLYAAWVPVAYIANRGTGLQNITYTDAQYMYVAGRLPSGENLVVGSRSVGSGTRNAIMNSTGIDTSWGRGDNVGNEVGTGNAFNAGPGTQRSNAQGSGNVESGVEASRLAVGYTGLAGPSRAASDALAGRYEVLNVCKDISGCDCSNVASFVRPTISSVLNNCDPCAGFTIGGQGSFVARGNPDANRNPMDPKYNADDPPLDNQEVANYFNNIEDSIDAFSGNVNAGECFSSEVCEFKKCSGSPDATCTGTGQGTCPSGQTCGFVNCVNDSDCAAIAPGLGDCNVPRQCSNNTPCTTKVCTQTGLMCTVDANCPPISQTCIGGLCDISGTVCIDDLDCAAVNQTCRNDICKSQLNSPGQYLATTFFIPAGIDCSQSQTDGTDFSPTVPLNQPLQNFTLSNNGLGIGSDTPAYGSVNTAGRVPIRNTLTGGAKYSDGSTSGTFTYWNGSSFVTNFASGLRLSKRNRLTGDMDEDGDRDVNDATELVKAAYAPRAWQQSARGIGNGTGSDLGNQTTDNGIPEVMADFNADGDLDKEDLRYFMDGLAVVPRLRCAGGASDGQFCTVAGDCPSGACSLAVFGVDRKAGAIAIDTAILAQSQELPWAEQRYSVTVPAAALGTEPTFLVPKDVDDSSAPFLKTGKTYASGDFRGDVAGGGYQACIAGRCNVTNTVCTVAGDCSRTPPTAGAQPMGWDGFVDAKDIDYCCLAAAIGTWTDLDEAVFIDLSCDMNGDNDVNDADVSELVEVILGTQFGDVDLDGDKDDDDKDIILASISGPNPCIATQTCGWADGDTNCDKVVDEADLSALPPAPVADPSGFQKGRYISFSLASAVAAPAPKAVRVILTSLHHPNPPNLPQFPSPNFTAFEGQVRWVGPPALCQENEAPLIHFTCATLQCTPFYADWSTWGLVHVNGVEVVPSSQYTMQSVAQSLSVDEESNFSSALVINTPRWGDAVAPFQAPSPAGLNQPNIGDVAAIVDKFKGVAGAAIVARTDIHPQTVNKVTNIGDVAATVDGFKGFAYPFAGIANCP